MYISFEEGLLKIINDKNSGAYKQCAYSNLYAFENAIKTPKIFKVCKQNLFIFRSCRGTSFKKEYF